MPILVLGCADVALQSLGTGSGVCTFRQTFLNEFPASVDLLGAAFDLQGFAARKFMSLELDKVELGPLPFAENSTNSVCKRLQTLANVYKWIQLST